ncbi:hypothetical protein [Cognatilysobacter tabacisoli]|uniref:hypothetical protein n=1 Tax=Cognatilysobacter tabacisoli TaxID=2315424 RepID=UPI001E4FF139|nr:hypothetical protein [Lysobacter tabacisoli]
MSEGWSPQQHEWLQAMGLQVFALAGTEPAVAEPAIAKPAVAEAPAAESRRPAAGAPARSARGAPSPAPRDAAAGQPPLLRALLKAARREAADPEFTRAVPDVDALRSAAAKRAAWPRLRALRRAGRA